MKFLKYNLLILLSAVLFSCYEDRSTYADEYYNEITIVSNLASDTINVQQGDTIRISPTYTSPEDTEMTYKWEFATYTRTISDGVTYYNTKFETVVSTEKDLAYAHGSLGEYQIRLTATNEDASTVKIFQVYVEAAFEEGFCIIGVDEDNKYSVSFQLCSYGDDIGEEWQQNCFERMNGYELPTISNAFKTYTHLYLNAPDEQKLIRLTAKTMLLDKEYDYSTMGEDFYCKEALANNYQTYASSSPYLPNTGTEKGGIAYVNVNYADTFWNSDSSDSLVNTDAVIVPDMYSGVIFYRFHENNRVTAAWDYVVNYWRDNNYNIINKFVCDFTGGNSYLCVLSKNENGDLLFNKMGQSGNYYNNVDELDITADVILSDNAELITENTVFYNNDYYAVAFFSNKDNTVYKWAYNQNQLPGEPFITLPEGEEIQFIDGFPITSSTWEEPLNDYSEVHIYTYNPNRSGLKGSMYRYDSFSGQLLYAHEGVSNRPVDGIYVNK